MPETFEPMALTNQVEQRQHETENQYRYPQHLPGGGLGLINFLNGVN